MVAFDFSLIANTAINFDAAGGDTITISGVDASAVGFARSGSDTVITSGGSSVTLTGAALEVLTSTNVLFGTTNGQFQAGDNTTSDTVDLAANTINLATDDEDNQVFGLGGGDDIDVGDGDNLIFGGVNGDTADSGDTIDIGQAAVGSNTVFGNGGNDTIDFDNAAAAGTTNSVFGGSGNDLVTDQAAMNGNLTVLGGLGQDTLTLDGLAAGSNALLTGGNAEGDTADGADSITAGVGNASIFGNGGNDTIVTGAIAANNSQSLFGGAGNDSMTIGDIATNSAVTLVGGLGQDTLDLDGATSNGNATVLAIGGNATGDTADGADTILWGVQNGSMFGNGGHDTITIAQVLAGNGTTTAVSVFGGQGNDTIGVSGAQDGADIIAFGNLGNDVFNIDASAFANNVVDIVVSDFNSGTNVFNVTLDGGAAAAGLSFDGGGSSPVLTNTGNHDRYVFSNFTGDFTSTNFVISDGSVLLTNFSGTAGTLTGGAGEADLLVSGSTGDTLDGGNTAGGTNDHLIGNDGDDTFQFSVAAAEDLSTAGTVSGGSGTDTLEVTGSTAVTLVNGDFTGDITSLEVLKVSNVTGHSVTLGAGAVTAGLTTIDASALSGTNSITIDDNMAFASNLTITTGAGADMVTRDTATDHTDTFDFAGGNDMLTIVTANLTSSDTYTFGAGSGDSMTVSDAASLVDADFTNVTGLENVVLTDADDQTLTLGTEASEAGINLINATALTTGGNQVTVTATNMTTALGVDGGVGNDTILGGSAADTINGGAGADSLTGGSGADTYEYLIATVDTTQANVDTITDFSTSDIFDFTNLTNANLNGTGTGITTGDGTAVDIDANAGLYIATNAAASLSAANIATAVAGATGDNDSFYILISDGTDAVLVLGDDTGGNGDGTIDAGEVNFVATLSGVTNSELSSFGSANFADFS